MLTNKKLGFIGGGNMAEALVKGLVATPSIEADNIILSDPVTERLEYLQKEYSVKTTTNNRELVKISDILIVAVKPQVIKGVLAEVADLLDSNKLIISVVAGLPISFIENILDPSGVKKISVARTMPNTPALVQEGMTAICFSSQVSKVNVEVAHYIFKAIGETVTIDENSIDAVTGLSGSGPAYILMVIEALSDAGVKVGLSRETSNKLTMQTVLGTAKLVRDSGKHPGELKDMVTSPGGTTIAGLHKLEAGGLRNTLINAVEAATNRSKELGKKYSEDS